MYWFPDVPFSSPLNTRALVSCSVPPEIMLCVCLLFSFLTAHNIQHLLFCTLFLSLNNMPWRSLPCVSKELPHSFFLLCGIPWRGCAPASLTRPLLTDIRVVSTLCHHRQYHGINTHIRYFLYMSVHISD